MIHTIIETNVLLYVMTAITMAGVLCQMITNRCYRHLLRDASDMQVEKSDFMKRIQYRYQIDKRRSNAEVNIPVFIQKTLMEYRFKKLSIHQWKRVSAGLYLLGMILAGVGSLYCWKMKNVNHMVLLLEAAGVLTILFGAAVLWCDSRYKEKRLSIQLQDYLYHSGANAELQEVDLDDIPVKEKQVPAVIGLRKKNDQKAVSRAQKDKKELQESLARMKEAVKETAASEEESNWKRERGRELLRQLDAKEQERIIRDVLAEFLA